MIFLELRKCFVFLPEFNFSVCPFFVSPIIHPFLFSFGSKEFWSSEGVLLLPTPSPSLLLSGFLEKILSANLGGI